MGQLVFQAALGGQVNLVGPNTASTFNLNVPAASDTLVARATTDTLTNKTLTSPVISGGTIDNAVIGGTTAVAGSFTTVTASTSVTAPFLTSAASTSLLLKSAGTTAVTIDTSQNVGIGMTPTYKLDVTGSIRTSNTMYLSGGDGSIQRSGGNTWIMLSSNTGYNSNGVHLKLDNSTSAGSFNFFSVGTQILGMAGTGRTLVLQGGTDSAGAGIAFPATQSASSDVNTLDDYEEGTFTPSFTTDGTAPVISASTAYGSYTKIGRIVNFVIHLANTTVTSVGTGNMVIAGLPFGVAGDYATFPVGFVQGFTTNQPSVALGRVSLSSMWLYYRTAANAGTSNNLAADAKTGMEIYISGAYQTNT